LEADDAQALNDWLNRYGYVSNPELTEWLAPYVAKNWKITAFRIVHDPATGKPVATKPVRMSFATEKPFFPYSEPKQRAAAKDGKDGEKEKFKKERTDPFGARRVLRVFFMGPERMAGKFGDKAWTAETYWAGTLESAQRNVLTKDLGVAEGTIPEKAWLTTFHDNSSPREGTEDVYFSTASQQTPVEPRPIRGEPTWIPIDLVLVVGTVVVLLACPQIIRKLRKS